jgi:predicted dehydrogenase
MKVIIAGMGIQGSKRMRYAREDVVATVDPEKKGVDYRNIEDVPIASFDAALLCIPDQVKTGTIMRMLEEGKHVLVEKPLMSEIDDDLLRLQEIAHKKNLVCYTAYNHRFEPHVIGIRDVVQSGRIGEVYRIRMYYGNGTARDVRDSSWRDQGAGVLPDLGSHLLDTLLFIFDEIPEPAEWKLWACRRFENQSPDHVVVAARPNGGGTMVELEMSLLSWRNHFVAEVYGSKGSVIMESFCKWGPSTLTIFDRLLPSGYPPAETITLSRPDPTWEAEYGHFKQLVEGRKEGNTGNDILFNRVLQELSERIFFSQNDSHNTATIKPG